MHSRSRVKRRPVPGELGFAAVAEPRGLSGYQTGSPRWLDDDALDGTGRGHRIYACLLPERFQQSGDLIGVPR